MVHRVTAYMYEHSRHQARLNKANELAAASQHSVVPSRMRPKSIAGSQTDSINLGGAPAGTYWQRVRRRTEWGFISLEAIKLIVLSCLAVHLLTALITIVLSTHYPANKVGLQCTAPLAISWEYYPLLASFGLYVFGLLPYALWKVWNIRDSLGIGTELRWSIMTTIGAYVGFMSWNLGMIWCAGIRVNGCALGLGDLVGTEFPVDLTILIIWIMAVQTQAIAKPILDSFRDEAAGKRTLKLAGDVQGTQPVEGSRSGPISGGSAAAPPTVEPITLPDLPSEAAPKKATARRRSRVGDTDANANLVDAIFQHPELLKRLKTYAASQFSIDSVLFYEDLMSVYRVARETSAPGAEPDPARAAAVFAEMTRLMQTYIYPGSDLEVNLEGSVRRETIAQYEKVARELRAEKEAPAVRAASVVVVVVAQPGTADMMNRVFGRARKDVQRLIRENTLSVFLQGPNLTLLRESRAASKV